MDFRPELVSVVIPTYNGRADLEKSLPALFSQEVEFPFEVICIDSSSADGTWELLGDYPIERHRISREEFSHGGTRNRGIELSRGEIIILMTQDAIPVGDQWMATLVRNYEDPEVAGVYCRQLPRPDGTLLAKVDLRLCLSGSSLRKVNRIGDHPGYHSAPPEQRRMLCNFDDICSSMRRSVWTRFPLKSVNFAEDLEWGKRVFEAGHTLVFEPDAPVVHSHDRSFAYEFKRAFVTYDVLDDMFDWGDDGYRFSRALLDAVGAPLTLVRVYPEISEEPFRSRMKAYYTITTRVLGHACFSVWRRKLKGSMLGTSLQKLFYNGV